MEEVYTAADMQDIDPYAPILSYWDVDFSKQPAFTSEHFKKAASNGNLAYRALPDALPDFIAMGN